MSFDKLQSTWQSMDHGGSLKTSTEFLLKEVQRNLKHFEASVFWRDFREVSAGVCVAVTFMVFGVYLSLWSCFFASFVGFAIATFILVDRKIQKQRESAIDESLITCVQVSLSRINHQIWLLKNIVWWYLLPCFVSITALLGDVTWRLHKKGLGNKGVLIFACVAIVLVFMWIYWLNQSAVKNVLEPRRKELDELLASLKE